MTEKLIQYVELFFNDIPYSKESLQAKEKITSKLIDLYSETSSIDSVIEKYNSLNKLAVLAGYTEDDVKKWHSKKDLITREMFFKAFKRERGYAYFVTFLGIYSLIFLYNVVVDPHLIYVAFTFLFAGLSIYFYFKSRKKGLKLGKYSLDSYLYLERLRDKYKKKLINSIFFCFAFFGLLISTLIQLKSNSKILEVIEIINVNILYIEFILLFIGKNFLLVEWLDRRIKNNKTKKFYVHLKKVFAFAIFITYL